MICLIAGLFWYNAKGNLDFKESRIINIYGFDKYIDVMMDSRCAISVIQLRRDSFDVDTCFADIEKIKREYEKHERGADWKFILSDVNEKLKIHKSRKVEVGSIFEKIFLISNDQFRAMEDRMKNNGCDNVFALEIEIIDGESRDIFHLSDTRTCNKIYAAFMDDLITAFEKEAK